MGRRRSLDELVLDDDYFCGECGAEMERFGDVLVCPKCGHSVDVEDYMTEYEDEEEYAPTLEELEGLPDEEDEELGETYDEVYNELDEE